MFCKMQSDPFLQILFQSNPFLQILFQYNPSLELFFFLVVVYEAINLKLSFLSFPELQSLFLNAREKDGQNGIEKKVINNRWQFILSGFQ